MLGKAQGVAAVMASGMAFVAGYHTLANQSLVESVENTEAGVVVDRIIRLENIQCRGPLSHDLKIILEKQRARYYKLTGREFTHTCPAAE